MVKLNTYRATREISLNIFGVILDKLLFSRCLKKENIMLQILYNIVLHNRVTTSVTSN